MSLPLLSPSQAQSQSSSKKESSSLSDAVSNFHLTQVIQSKPVAGDHFRLYSYDREGFHSGGQWFTSGKIKYPDEQITAEAARALTEATMQAGYEVRITDSSDFLVFHALNGEQVYPSKTVDFWSQV